MFMCVMYVDFDGSHLIQNWDMLRFKIMDIMYECQIPIHKINGFQQA